tara:strand:+ start:3972 stop:4652 length:681 start_codon:yes stop_codon:yes gene_type:complete
MPLFQIKKSNQRVGKTTPKILHGLSALLILSGLYFSYDYVMKPNLDENGNTSSLSVIENYSNDVFKASYEFNIPYEYLMSLIQLECSGLKPAGERYEPHVYKQLKKVQMGSLKNYENVTASHLHDASDEALRNLATSWGPFQLMGYKCILLDVKIRDIRGSNGVHYGAKWINLTYGNRLRKGEYKNCFHLHNTGRIYPNSGIPTTYDPQYVPRGLTGLKRFSAQVN